MTSKDVYTSKKIDLKTCNFTKPDLVDGFRKSTIKINNLKHIVLQSPKLHIKSINDNYVELIISRNRENSREFYNVVSHLEDMIITTTSQNSEEWFGKKISIDQIESMFKSCIKCPLDIDDYFVIKIRKNKEVVFDLNYPVICIIKIYGIIFGKSNSMLDMKICHAKIIKNEEDNKIQDIKMMYYDDGNSITHNIFTNVEKRNTEKSQSDVPQPVDVKSEIKPVVAPDVKSVAPDVKSEIKPVVAPDVKSEIKPVVAPDVKSIALDVKSEIKPVVAPDVKSIVPDVKSEIKPVVASDVKSEIKPVEKQPVEQETKIVPDKKEENIDIESIKCDYMTASIKNDEETMSKTRAYIEKNDKNMYKLENDISDEDCGLE